MKHTKVIFIVFFFCLLLLLFNNNSYASAGDVSDKTLSFYFRNKLIYCKIPEIDVSYSDNPFLLIARSSSSSTGSTDDNGDQVGIWAFIVDKNASLRLYKPMLYAIHTVNSSGSEYNGFLKTFHFFIDNFDAYNSLDVLQNDFLNPSAISFVNVSTEYLNANPHILYSDLDVVSEIDNTTVFQAAPAGTGRNRHRRY